jgi:hypothetical protein
MLSRSLVRHGRSFSVGATQSQTGPGAFTTVGIPLALLGAAGGTYYYYANIDASLGGLLPASFARIPSPSSVASSSAAHAATLVPHAATPTTTKPVPTKVKLNNAIPVDTEKAERQAIALATTLSISEQAEATASLVIQTPHSNEKQHVVVETKTPTVSKAEPMPASFVAAVPIVAASPILPSPVKSAVEIAHAEMRALLYKDISSVLKKDFSESAVTEVSKLNEPALREKVVRLLEESHERARLEGIRLAEFLERSDNAWLKKVRAS